MLYTDYILGYTYLLSLSLHNNKKLTSVDTILTNLNKLLSSRDLIRNNMKTKAHLIWSVPYVSPSLGFFESFLNQSEPRIIARGSWPSSAAPIDVLAFQCHDYRQPSHLSHKAWNIHTPFWSRFLGLQLQILNSITHFQFSKWNKQYKWDKNSLDQKNIDFKGCECYMPCVKDGWVDGNHGTERPIHLSAPHYWAMTRAR